MWYAALPCLPLYPPLPFVPIKYRLCVMHCPLLPSLPLQVVGNSFRCCSGACESYQNRFCIYVAMFLACLKPVPTRARHDRHNNLCRSQRHRLCGLKPSPVFLSTLPFLPSLPIQIMGGSFLCRYRACGIVESSFFRCSWPCHSDHNRFCIYVALFLLVWSLFQHEHGTTVTITSDTVKSLLCVRLISLRGWNEVMYVYVVCDHP
jgi:hypothetical protein